LHIELIGVGQYRRRLWAIQNQQVNHISDDGCEIHVQKIHVKKSVTLSCEHPDEGHAECEIDHVQIQVAA
jgi:hypothetical protein